MATTGRATDTSPPGVFISYRRQDAAFPAGWLYERLVGHFGPPAVFKDVDSIRPGDDFVEAITVAVTRCHTMLVVIGPAWQALQAERNGSGPQDVVRLEIEAALAHGLLVIPVLVGEATMPMESELPPSIAALARRNAVVLNPNRFESAMSDLIPAVEQARRTAAERIRRDRAGRTRAERGSAGEAVTRARGAVTAIGSARLIAPTICTIGALLMWWSLYFSDWMSGVASAPLLVFLVLLFVGRRPAVAVGGIVGQALFTLETLVSSGYFGSFEVYCAAGTATLLAGCAIAVRNSPDLRRSASVRWDRWTSTAAVLVAVSLVVYGVVNTPTVPGYLAMLPSVILVVLGILVDLRPDQQDLLAAMLVSRLVAQLLLIVVYLLTRGVDPARASVLAALPFVWLVGVVVAQRRATQRAAVR